MGTFREDIGTWRSTNQGTALLKKLDIAGSLYDIHDPAVEALADLMESRVNALENKTWTPVTKGVDDPKFATSVTQNASGAITVTYDHLRASAYELSGTGTNEFITSIAQDVDGVISATKGGISAEQVALTGVTGVTGTDVKAAIAEVLAAAEALKGATGDAASAETIAGAKKYADEAVQALAGQDWTTAAKKVQDIINELEGSTVATEWSTLVDKLKGMTIADPTGAEGATKEATSVAEYVNAKIAEVNQQSAEGISALDAVVYGADGETTVVGETAAASAYTGDSTSKVVVKLTEVDGKITGLDVKTNDVAKASDLTTLSNEAVKSVNGQTGNSVTLYANNINVSDATGAATVAATLTSLESTKANKNAFQTGNVNDWSAPTYSNETLTWGYTGVSVYKPTGNTI